MVLFTLRVVTELAEVRSFRPSKWLTAQPLQGFSTA